MRKQSGFTLIEAITAIAIFAILTAGVLGLFSMLTRATKAAREQTILSALSASRLEVMRNLPFSEVGTVAGSPNGSLPDFTAPETITHEGVDYHIHYEVTYIDDETDGTILAGTDPAPNDYKQVNMYIENTVTGKVTQFTTNVSPQGLEGISNAGALLLRVFDAAGQPVPGATLSIVNTLVTPNISLNRTTDADGNWIEVGLPSSVNGYQITATKSGHSTDSTYPITAGNPNPVKPHATITDGTVTQVTFGIDLLSDLTVRTLDAACSAVNGVGVNISGSKLIGALPDVYKYNQDHTSSAGLITLGDFEWDVYYPLLLEGQSVMLYGTSPIQQVNVLPGASQVFTLVLGPESDHSLLVIVKDQATGVPIEGASVTLESSGQSYLQQRYTGGSVWNQGLWSGGSGQADWSSTDRYWSDDGNINASGGAVELATLGSGHVPAGQLESSTFDTGGSSNYTIMEWEPTSQNPDTELRFQIASNNDNATWNFLGPDGTGGSYYTVPGTTVNAVHNGDRYFRYKAFLTTSDSDFTPTLSNFSLNYVSGCSTPGQAMFPGLGAANDYELTVSMAGYANYTANSLNVNGNQALEVLLSP